MVFLRVKMGLTHSFSTSPKVCLQFLDRIGSTENKPCEPTGRFFEAPRFSGPKPRKKTRKWVSHVRFRSPQLFAHTFLVRIGRTGNFHLSLPANELRHFAPIFFRTPGGVGVQLRKFFSGSFFETPPWDFRNHTLIFCPLSPR